MSRASTSSQRNLTLTEELEKLEQSITLTLQEIDHNFSRVHRIITTSILPIVEQYAEHSKNVWEGSKFWKQFFEASANVSLSGYEETPPEDATLTTTTSAEDITGTTPSSSTYPSPHANDLSPSNQYNPHADNSTTSSFYSPATHSTPRPHQPTLATYSSPYETLRRETFGATTSPPHSPSPSATELPSTPRNPYNHSTASLSTDPQSSPFLPPSTAATHKARTPADDLLLHRVLDKNYRLQATPHTQTRLPRYNTATHKNVGATPQTTRQRRENTRYVVPEELDSSPIAPAPEIRTHVFSPAKGKRVPGVSVLTPAKKGAGGLGGKDAAPGRGGRRDIWDSDSDDDGLPEGMSPPKTMQFYIPQSKLLKTPGLQLMLFGENVAREASKKIVEGLLRTAGGDVTEEFDEDIDSPRIVRRGGLGEEDTF
ncbi:DASH complex subunit ask1 [Trapelia coarctata]|nr:DASH complex subunit ask1 [Trapelia coarctata]